MKVTRKEVFGEPQIFVSMDEIANPVAELAFRMLDRWGPVVATPDGVDDAGRQKMRNMSAPETVTQAFNIAVLAYKEAKNRGLMISINDVEEN
jgi:hypothetical protein